MLLAGPGRKRPDVKPKDHLPPGLARLVERGMDSMIGRQYQTRGHEDPRPEGLKKTPLLKIEIDAADGALDFPHQALAMEVQLQERQGMIHCLPQRGGF